MPPPVVMDFEPTGAPLVGDTVWHRASDRPAVVLSVESGRAAIAFAVRCRCRAGDLVYRDQAWSWACPVCGWHATDAELRDLLTGVCTVRGCYRPHHARGRCVVCYERWRRTLPHRRAAKAEWARRPEVKRRRNAADRRAWPRRRKAHREACRARRAREREAVA